MTSGTTKIALIGFGEVGSLFARELLATGRHSVATYDILFDAAQGAAMKEKARNLGAETGGSAAAAAKEALVVISAVTATSAADVAREAGGYLRPGQFFLASTPGRPGTSRGDGGRVAGWAAVYAGAAVLRPVAPTASRCRCC